MGDIDKLAVSIVVLVFFILSAGTFWRVEQISMMMIDRPEFCAAIRAEKDGLK